MSNMSNDTSSALEYLLFFTKTTGDADIDADLKYLWNLDFASTVIGHIPSWPRELLVLMNLAMLSPQPQLFLLGPDSIIIYNTAYGRLLCDHHPEYQGRPISQNTALFAQAQAIQRIRNNATTRDRPANENRVPFFFLDHGILREVFLSATMFQLPLSLSGFHATTYDITAEVLRDRRADSLLKIRKACQKAPDMITLQSSLLRGIEAGDGDISFAMLYRAHTELERNTDSGFVSKTVDPTNYLLAGSVGAFRKPPLSVLSAEMHDSFSNILLQTAASRAQMVISRENQTLPLEICEASRNRCYNEDCREAVVLPSTLDLDADNQILLVIGLAPRRPYDEAYRNWIQTLHQDLIDMVASVTILEETALAKTNHNLRVAKEKEIFARELMLKDQVASTAALQVQRMLNIMQAASVGVFECIASGKLLSVNNAFCTLSGCPKYLDTAHEITLSNLCDPEDLKSLDLHWKSLLSGHPETFLLRFCGELDREVCSITGCAIDISAQKEVEKEATKRVDALEKLRLSEARLLQFIENVPLGVLIMDRNIHVSFVNNMWIQLSGHEPVPVEDIDLYSVIFPDDIPIFDKWMQNLLKSFHSVVFQMRLQRRFESGKTNEFRQAWVLFTAFTQIVGKGEVQIMAAMTDISSMKYAESLQQQRLEEAVEAKRAQENFVDMTSHEIRNPLNAVMHCADMLSQSLSDMLVLSNQIDNQPKNLASIKAQFDELYDSMSETSETIMSCTLHQKRITDDILSLSKLDSHLVEISYAVLNLHTFLNQLQMNFKAEATQAGTDLKVLFDPSIEELSIKWLHADSGRLMQIVINLVTNALKFTKDKEPPGEKTVTITIGSSLSTDVDVFSDLIMARSIQDVSQTPRTADSFYLWFKIRDSGCGMNAASRARIFSRFTQASPKTYQKYGGSGLGLFISQKLVALQGGEIGFSSQENEGSTFAFYVQASRATPPPPPATIDHTSSVDDNQHLTTTAIPTPLSGVSDDFSHISILLVEDNLVNQRVLRKQLERRSCTVYTADNGQAAFDFLQTTQHWSASTTTSPSSSTTQPSSLAASIPPPTAALALLSTPLAAINLSPSQPPPPSKRPHIDVILMDIEMPLLNGLACATLIRAAQRDGRITGHLKIIAVTANARKEHLEKAREVGMDEVITKPFRVGELGAVLRRAGVVGGRREKEERGGRGEEG